MKKLLSLVLCVALLMGACASALADRNLQGLLQDNNTFKDDLRTLFTDIILSAGLMNRFYVSLVTVDHQVDESLEYMSNDVKNIVDTLGSILSDEVLQGIKAKADIGEDDYNTALSISQRGVDLLPSIRKYDMMSDEYNTYYETLPDEVQKEYFSAMCAAEHVQIVGAVWCLEEAKKMIADWQKQSLGLR